MLPKHKSLHPFKDEGRLWARSRKEAVCVASVHHALCFADTILAADCSPGLLGLLSACKRMQSQESCWSWQARFDNGQLSQLYLEFLLSKLCEAVALVLGLLVLTARCKIKRGVHRPAFVPKIPRGHSLHLQALSATRLTVFCCFRSFTSVPDPVPRWALAVWGTPRLEATFAGWFLFWQCTLSNQSRQR